MSARGLLVGAILIGASMTGKSCLGSGNDADFKPPLGFVPPPVRELQKGPLHGRLGFGRGFFPMELGPSGETWRWMGSRGEIRLLNDNRTRRLRILGWVPIEFLQERPTIRVTLHDQVLDSFEARERELNKAYIVKPSLLGSAPSVLLVIETSMTIRAPGDTRDLGVSVEGVKWEMAP